MRRYAQSYLVCLSHRNPRHPKVIAIIKNRNFVNKLWNAGKYLQNVLSSVSEEEKNDLANRG